VYRENVRKILNLPINSHRDDWYKFNFNFQQMFQVYNQLTQRPEKVYQIETIVPFEFQVLLLRKLKQYFNSSDLQLIVKQSVTEEYVNNTTEFYLIRSRPIEQVKSICYKHLKKDLDFLGRQMSMDYILTLMVDGLIHYVMCVRFA